MADCVNAGTLPCAIIVSYCDTQASDIVKGILKEDQLPESLPVYGDSIKTFLWGIDTKYYTANVHLCIVKDEKFGNGEVLENMQALAVYFDSNKEASFNRVKVLMSLVNGFEPEVRLLVCDNCSQGNSAISKLNAQEWCLQNGFELVELYPDDLSDSEDDFAETTGIKRIIQALHAHTWSNLNMKEKSSLFSPQLKNVLQSDTSKPNEPTEMTDDLEACMANVNIKEVQEDSKQSLSDPDSMDAMGNDSSGQSFEALFDAFQQMKDRAIGLQLPERKLYAEKVAIAFWKAMGGDEDEIAGLDSDGD